VRKLVTKLDVAKLAGVSSTTVSRILNDNGYVSEEVRKRVLKAIKELDYVPNRMARSLRTKKTGQIACITYGLKNAFYAEVVQGIKDEALDNGYTFTIYSSKLDKQQYKQLIFDGSYDGLIILTPLEFLEHVDPEKLPRNIPMSMYWDLAGKTNIPNVKINLRAAMDKIVNHLLDNGHSNIVYLGSTEDGNGFHYNQRLKGYIKSLTNSGISPSDDYLFHVPTWEDTPSYGYIKIKELIKKNVPFTAIAASNDLMAIGAMRALSEHGLRVPNDVSITGFDDIELAGMITPSLTTISFPKKRYWSHSNEHILEFTQK